MGLTLDVQKLCSPGPPGLGQTKRVALHSVCTQYRNSERVFKRPLFHSRTC